jgi:carbonic anhydrase/acetyltransferase-like protein (isoleucine patch superfamily)
VLIGIGAIVLDGCEVGDDCMIAAGALVTPGTKIPSGQLASARRRACKRPLERRGARAPEALGRQLRDARGQLPEARASPEAAASARRAPDAEYSG